MMDRLLLLPALLRLWLLILVLMASSGNSYVVTRRCSSSTAASCSDESPTHLPASAAARSDLVSSSRDSPLVSEKPEARAHYEDDDDSSAAATPKESRPRGSITSALQYFDDGTTRSETSDKPSSWKRSHINNYKDEEKKSLPLLQDYTDAASASAGTGGLVPGEAPSKKAPPPPESLRQQRAFFLLDSNGPTPPRSGPLHNRRRHQPLLQQHELRSEAQSSFHEHKKLLLRVIPTKTGKEDNYQKPKTWLQKKTKNSNKRVKNAYHKNGKKVKKESNIYFIKLPPSPYSYVPGLGYVSQPPNFNLDAGNILPVNNFPEPEKPVIKLPIDFVSNGKPTNVYRSTKDSPILWLNRGPYVFDGRPTTTMISSSSRVYLPDKTNSISRPGDRRLYRSTATRAGGIWSS